MVESLWYAARVQTLLRASAFATLGFIAACGHKPPYRVGEQPASETLLERTEPQLGAIAVSDAQITLDRVVRAELLMLAQADSRFRATVNKAGNELVTLAFTEEGYAMRYKLDSIPPGFYSGPADPCAVQAVLGVPLSYEGLVALILGGAPLVEGATVVKQKWDRKQGYEVLTLEGGGFVQDLWFAWVGGAWVFSGGQMWEGTADARGRWLWTLEHDKHEKVEGILLPGRTKVRAPGRKRSHLIVLSYKKRDANPGWSATSEPTGGDDGGSGDGGDDGGWESGDDGGWENEDDGGWENEEPTEDSTPPEESPAPPSGVLAAVLQATSPDAGASRPPIPVQFQVTSEGLTNRGDLCR